MNTPAVLSIDEFKTLLNTASVTDIEKIPVDTLPRVIPDEIIASVNGEKRKLLENIIFDLNMREVNERLVIEANYNTDVSNALFYFSDYFGKENYSIMSKKLAELARVYKEWKADRLESKRLSMLPRIVELNNFVDLLRTETKSIVNAQQTLKTHIADAKSQDKAQFQAEIKNLHYVIQRNQDKMAQYYYLRLMVIGADMRYLSTKIKSSASAIEKIEEKIAGLRKDLIKVTGQTALFQFSKAKHNPIASKLQTDINQLIEDKAKLDVPISETHLIAWLDVVVDASVTIDDTTRESQPNLLSLINKIRMTLFHLLQTYCVQQENAATEVAQNPFSQAAPEEFIKFVIKSEEFILNYFKQKRIETAAWMGDLAESKVDMLNDIEKSLLKELKRNSKLSKSYRVKSPVS